MRVAIYNQMFGLDGRSLFSYLRGHWAVHFQSNPNKIWKLARLDKTIEIVKRADADIIGICEILEGQQDKLKKELMKIGYNRIYFGYGHKTKYSNLHVIEAIASKFPCKQIDIGRWLVEDRIGGGGGLGAVYIPKLKTTFFNVHLGLPRMKYFQQQIGYVSDKIMKTKGKIIVVGDFNLEYNKIKQYFPDLKLISGRIKTCSLTPITKWFYWKDCDHIFVKGFEKKKLGELRGYSDHKLIYADLE